MKIKSSRGVYYVRDKSPYRLDKYGLIFIFSSQAKLKSFERKLNIELERVNKQVEDLKNILSPSMYITVKNQNNKIAQLIAERLFNSIETWGVINGND